MDTATTPDRKTADSVSKNTRAATIHDRAQQDVVNIVALEHVNLWIPDMLVAMDFYMAGLGFTRDPYIRVGSENMAANVGRSQFHLSARGIQRLRGTIGIVLPDLGDLVKRLERVAPRLKGTQFGCRAHADHVDVTCPWGNRFRCHAPSPEFGPTDLAIAYVEFDVPRGMAAGIARFYGQVFRAAASIEQSGKDAVACVRIGGAQKLLFHETDAEIPPFDGHHIAIYIADFSGPYRFLKEHGLVIIDESVYQYNFRDIIDPDSAKVLFTVEHEVRCLNHPLYARPFINRNTALSPDDYVRGHENFEGTY
jgi:hypothetical protein